MKTAALTSAFLTTFAFAYPAFAQTFQTEAVPIEAEVIANGLRNPWGMDFLPDGSAIVTERIGQIRILSAGGDLSEPVAGVPDVVARGQGGLLDIVAAPDFASSNLVFFSFSEAGTGGAGTAVARARLEREGDQARLEDVEIIFSMAKKTGVTRHFGSRLVFAPDGTLFVTTGDRGERNRAQDMQDHAGAVIRINIDGSIPADNPAPDGAGQLPEIWSKGHRNAQGAVWDPVLGGLLTVEHGDKGGDEVNHARAGRNYGWPVISYGVTYGNKKIGVGSEAPGYEQPLFYWDPSIAPSGLVIYQGDMFPEWKGDLLIGALKSQLVSRLDRDEKGVILGEERLFKGTFGRIRDVAEAPDGSIWLLTDARNGQIIRLSRAD